MTDYVRGVLEALAWTRRIVEQAEERKHGLTWAQCAIDEALNDVLTGMVYDFRERLKIPRP